MNVLHVISGLFYGGGQRVVEDLLAALPQHEELRTSLCTLGTGASICGQAEHTILYDGRYNRPWVLVEAASGLRRVLDEQSIDLLHTHGLDADLIGGLAVLTREVKHICHLHVSPPQSGKQTWQAGIRRKAYRFLAQRNETFFLAVSDAVRRQMVTYYRLPPARVVTVRNGIDTATFCRSQPVLHDARGSSVIGTAARLAPMKGLEYLMDAMSALKQQGVPCVLKIAGEGPLRSELEQRIREHDLSQHVHLLGHVENMTELYGDLDLFVLPSVSTEGLPLVVLEAMASRLPVVATDVGGTAEAVRDGIDGRIVAPGNVEALSLAIRTLVDDPELRATMGEAGRTRVLADFSRERMAREVHEMYTRVLGQVPVPAGAA